MFLCQPSQTAVTERKLTKLCQTLGGKSRLQFTNCCMKFWGLPDKLAAPKLSTFGRCFRGLLLTNIFNDIDNRKSALEIKKGSPTLSRSLVNFSPQIAKLGP